MDSTPSNVLHINPVIKVYHEVDKICNNANICIRSFKMGNQKIPVTKWYPPRENWTQDLWFQVQHSPFWVNLTFACKTETLGYLHSHALLILTKSSKSKNQVMHEQKFKDPQVAHAKLAHKGECKTWNQRCQLQSSLRVTFCYWIFFVFT